MKVSDAYRLAKWVNENRQMILVDAPTQTRLCELATGALGCKVSSNAMRDAMAECGMKTKRESQAVREKQALEEKVAVYRELLIKYATACTAPEWLRDEIISDPRLEDSLKNAMIKMDNKHVA